MYALISGFIFIFFLIMASAKCPAKCQPRYQKEMVDASTLRSEFSKQPCCTENCVRTKLAMPVDMSTTSCCSAHWSMEFAGVCAQQPVEGSSSASDQEFQSIVFHTRTVTRNARKQEADDKGIKVGDAVNEERVNEERKRWGDHLVKYWGESGRHTVTEVDGKKQFHWIYNIFHPTKGPIEVCRNAFMGVYGVSLAQLRYAQMKVRENQGGADSLEDPHAVLTLESVFDKFGMDLDFYRFHYKSFMNVEAVPDSEGSLVAVSWLSDYFDMVGEQQPDTFEINYDPINLSDIWTEYKDSPIVTDTTAEIVSYAQFTFLIRTVFPNVKQRAYKSVTGKCHICERLRSLMKECTLRSDKLMVREYRMLHRNNYIGEKIKYYDRIAEARASQGRVVSFIFDGMSKFRSRLPILGNQSKLDTEFNNNIMGCIAHVGRETRFYESFASVSPGASYMIHCIHTEINRLVENNLNLGTPMPTKIYLQIDGASDNTAYAVIASLEHLVAKELCDCIEVWRLPVGHTHEVRIEPTTYPPSLSLLLSFTSRKAGHCILLF